MSDEEKKEQGPQPGAPPLSSEEDAAERAFQSGAPRDSHDEELDPELMKLPRRRRRHPLIALLVIGLSLYLMYFVKDDLLFFLQPRRPTDLGDVAEAVREGKLRHNTYVTLAGAPDRKHALILEARFGGFDSFFRLLQTGNRVFVQQHRRYRASDETLSGGYTGRLARFDTLPYHKALSAYFSKTMTVAHEVDLKSLERARSRGERTVKDQTGAEVPVGPDTPFWINVAYKDEWLLQASKRHHATLEDAQRLLEGAGLPFAVDDEPSASFWRFVIVSADPEKMPSLMARFRDPDLHANLVRRQLSYSARYDQLSVEGNTLVINAADPTAPSRYRPITGPGGETRLQPSRETPARVPADAVLFITTSSALQIPEDAFVLVTGKHPSQGWYYAVLYLLLLGFIVINAATLVQRLRDRSR